MNTIEVPSAVDPNPGPVKHPGRISGEPVPGTDYEKAPGRWLGPNTDVRQRKTLSSECLAALRQAAADAGRQLTDGERAVILKKFQ
jgi:hypothetical protein